MKRDMDLCRTILQHIEGLNAGVYSIEGADLRNEFSEVGQEAINHQVKITVPAL